MLNHRQRAAILELYGQGIGTRKIARTLKLCRNAVKKVIRCQSEQVPSLERPFKAKPYPSPKQEEIESC